MLLLSLNFVIRSLRKSVGMYYIAAVWQMQDESGWRFGPGYEPVYSAQDISENRDPQTNVI
jgi:hypothetical protein